MKGIVFTEFLEMVEEKIGYEVTENMIENANLPSKGACTAVGTYDHKEMYSLIGELHKSTKIPVPDLMHTYGYHLFGALAKAYAPMLSSITSAFDMLKSVDQYIHVEVRKPYPDAELPQFEIEHIDDKRLVMIYTSERRMSDVASGLIVGCLALQSTGAQSKRRSRDSYSNRAYSRTQTVHNTGTHNLPLYLTRATIRTNDLDTLVHIGDLSPRQHRTARSPCQEVSTTTIHRPLTLDQRHAEFPMCTSQDDWVCCFLCLTLTQATIGLLLMRCKETRWFGMQRATGTSIGAYNTHTHVDVC